MRALALATFLTLSISSAHAQSVEEKVAVGPWEIATTFRGSTFINCEMRRTSDGLGITFLRAEDGLSLLLDSAKWKLERGKTYNVKLSAGVGSIDGKAQAESKGVAIALPDRPFTARLRSADTLDVRGDGATLRVRSMVAWQQWIGLRRVSQRTQRTVRKQIHLLRRIGSHNYPPQLAN